MKKQYSIKNLMSPYPLQRQVIDAILQKSVSRVILRCGRRTGKTFLLAMIACILAGIGLEVHYYGPISKQTGQFWRYVSAFMKPLVMRKKARVLTYPLKICEVANGGRIEAGTAYNRDGIRGGSCDLLLLDEAAYYREDIQAAAMPLLFDRDGIAVYATTPASIYSEDFEGLTAGTKIKELWEQHEDDENWMLVTYSSYDAPHISHAAIELAREEMTDVEFQTEVMAIEVDHHPDALWRPEDIRHERPDGLDISIVGVDPGGSDRGTTGIVTSGLYKGDGFVMRDSSVRASDVEGWATAAIRDYYEFGARAIRVERNYGGEMLRDVIRNRDADVRVSLVQSQVGKGERAAPLASEYARGRWAHDHHMPDLERQMTTWVNDSGSRKKSPDRLDALVISSRPFVRSKRKLTIPGV